MPNQADTLTDQDLLAHFDGKTIFKSFRANWPEQQTAAFCRLVRAVHAAGLDWWHVGKTVQLRFGRKNPGSDRAVKVLGIVRGKRTRTISITRGFGSVTEMHRVPITDSLLNEIEAALPAAGITLEGDAWQAGRIGLWPDQLHEDTPEPGDGDDLEELSVEQPLKALNRIYYGPPGTGKTYRLSQLLRSDYEQPITSVLPEEWRTQFIADKIAVLKWWEVTALALIDLGEEATVGELMDHPFIAALARAKGRNGNVRQTIWGTLQERTVEESVTVKQKARFSPQIFDKSAKSVWRFAGEWREACADLIVILDDYRAGPQLVQSSQSFRRYSFVTFHQSYGYEEFVEGLRPVLDDESDASEVKYKIVPGIFKELCQRARLAPDQRFAMVIDEINRGNVSKIFGELITLIELDKREGEKNEISVVLPYSRETFSIPPNIDVIGTMNTADRSLALLDIALRRRFDFEPLLPDARDTPDAPLYGLRVKLGDEEIHVPKMLSAINERIECLYDRDHCIGHAYFTSLATVPDGEPRMRALASVFRNRILPLLEEYFFEDWQKIRLILADNQKPEDLQFIKESKNQSSDLADIFGSDHNFDNVSVNPRHEVQHGSFDKPRAYIGVYTSLVAK